MNRAWIFAAGLLLGFWLFARCDKSEADIMAAFQQSRSALQKMAAFSPQAGHYCEILTTLGHAIDTYCAKKIEERKRLSSRYVDQILTFDAESTPGAYDQDYGASPPGAPATYQPGDEGSYSTNPEGLEFESYTPLGTTISGDFPWPADDLEIDWQLFASFLDDVG